MTTRARTVREVVLGLALAVTLLHLIVQLALGLLTPARVAWGVSSTAALVVLVLVARRGSLWARRWVPVGVTGVMSLAIPAFLGAEEPQSYRLQSLVAVPLLTAFLYFDHFLVVATVGLAGLVAAAASSGQLGFDGRHQVEFVSSMGLVHGLAVLCAWGYSRQRRAEERQTAERVEQLQQAERRQAHAERMALVGQLAAGVAHEINNPLAFVRANVALVEAHLEGAGSLGDESPAQVLAETQEGLERIREIVADLKAFARDEADPGRPVHLADALQEALRLASVSMPRGVFVECTGLSSVPLVSASHRKLVQVFLNLLVNAGSALEQAGTKDPRVTVTVHLVDGGVAVEVSDNGPGVPAEVRPRLFEPFFTTKPPGKGTGLGLAMSREMVRAMGGELRFEPQEVGARFVVVVPLEARRTPGETPAVDPTG